MKELGKVDSEHDVKIILLGDSAVGKSKLMERYLLDDYIPYQSSTYALTLYRHVCPNPLKPGEDLKVDFWDTAGYVNDGFLSAIKLYPDEYTILIFPRQERFQSMHRSYYYGAHCCILVFDVTRKVTYKNLDTWYEELISHRGLQMPVIVVANKIDMDPSRAERTFQFIEKNIKARGGNREDFPLYFVSASDGSNVVTIFKEAIKRAVKYKKDVQQGKCENFIDEVMEFIKDEKKRVDGGIFKNDLSSPALDTKPNDDAQQTIIS